MTHAQHPAPTSAVPPSVLEVTLRSCHDASEYAGLETALKKVPGVTSVHLDRTRGVAHLGYDPRTVSQPELEKRLHAAGYACDCADCQPSVTQLDGLRTLIAGEDYPPYKNGLPDYVTIKGVAVKKKLNTEFKP